MPALQPGILFTSFEPSGDDHAAAVIAELKARRPDLPIYAWGGSRMQKAGATIVERTGENAVIGLPGPGKVLEHLRVNRRIRRWMRQGLAAVHVPVDSPAANFPICKIAKEQGLTVVHLVAPQIWAWGRWRIRKLRRLTDRVLCLLPFEENWFLSRGVAARFVGHPLFDHPLDTAALDERARAIEATTGTTRAALEAVTPSAAPRPIRLALMPGSRPAEWKACFPILLDAFERLKADFPDTVAVVAATKPAVADQLRQMALASAAASESGPKGGPNAWPSNLHIVSGDTDAVIRWCDYALVVSGTVTLQIARQAKPMIAVYRPNRVVYHLLARWLVTTEHFTLPNLIAGKRIVPELIPHFGDGEALAVEVIKLMRRENYADDQREALARISRLFDGRNAASATADELEKVLDALGAPAVRAGSGQGDSPLRDGSQPAKGAQSGSAEQGAPAVHA